MGYLSFYFLLLPVFGCTAAVAVSGGGIVKSLPIYGDLPFTLETGYIGVGENEEVQLFYYFVESEKNPQDDPLLLWVPAGPSCSSLGPFFFEIGPLSMDTENYVGGLPKLLTSEYAWTKDFNIIFLDAPAGVGFSYTETAEDQNKYLNDAQYAENTYEFLQKWLKEHPTFLNNSLYLSGEGYAGTIIALVLQKILDGNDQGIEDEQIINVKGYAMGNPGADTNIDFGSQVPFYHRLSLISDDIFKEAYESCNGTYFPKPTEVENQPCYSVLEKITQLICAIEPNNILTPSCTQTTDSCNTSMQIQLKSDRSMSRILSESLAPASNKTCPKDKQTICEHWARDPNVQEALNIRQGKVTDWSYCTDNVDKSYNRSVPSVVGLHSNFTSKSIRGLIFSGDHDPSIPFIGTQQWIESLKLPLIEAWRAWFVDGEVVGYMRKYQQENFTLTFTTVKGAGHAAAEDYRAECYYMMRRWMDTDSL